MHTAHSYRRTSLISVMIGIILMLIEFGKQTRHTHAFITNDFEEKEIEQLHKIHQKNKQVFNLPIEIIFSQNPFEMFALYIYNNHVVYSVKLQAIQMSIFEVVNLTKIHSKR